MSIPCGKSINILIDGQKNQRAENNSACLQINFIDTQNELSNQKTISVVNEQPQTTSLLFWVSQIIYDERIKYFNDRWWIIFG